MEDENWIILDIFKCSFGVMVKLLRVGMRRISLKEEIMRVDMVVD